MTTATVWDMLAGRPFRWVTFSVKGHCRTEWVRIRPPLIDPEDEIAWRFLPVIDEPPIDLVDTPPVEVMW